MVRKWVGKGTNTIDYGDFIFAVGKFAELLSILVKKRPLFVIDCINTILCV